MGGRGGGGHGSTSEEARKHELYERVQEDWGGATINQATGNEVKPQDAYAVTDTETISIDENASYKEFSNAYDEAKSRFGSSPNLGIFHDNAKGTIDFNGTQIVKTTADVDRLYAQGNPVTGGAYHLTGDGNDYWPQGQPKAYAA